MYCQNCGTYLPDNSNFCSNCGKSFVNQTRGVSYTQTPVNTSKKSHWFLKTVLFLLLIVLAFVGYTLLTMDLYVYREADFTLEQEISNQEKRKIEDFFKNTYLLNDDDGCLVFNINNGLGFDENDIAEEERVIVKFDIPGNYAYIDLESPTSNEKVTFIYFRANLLERIRFATSYYAW